MYYQSIDVNKQKLLSAINLKVDSVALLKKNP